MPDREEMGKSDSAGKVDVSVSMGPAAASKRPSSGPRSWKRGRGLAVTLGVTLAAIQIVVIGALAFFFQAHQFDAAHDELKERARTYGLLTAAQLGPAVAFDDRETAREVFDALANDAELEGASIYRQDGTSLHSFGSLSPLAARGRFGVDELSVFSLPGRVLTVARVTSKEGPRGTLVIELSKKTLVAGRQILVRTTLIVALFALVLACGAAFLVARVLAKRLGRIADAAERVARGELDGVVIHDKGGDEVSSLSFSFNVMVERLRFLMEERERLAKSEQERLEELVSRRTSELSHRNEDMRRVLNNIDQGLMTIDREAKVGPELSTCLMAWFGRLPEGRGLWDYFEQVMPGSRERFALAWEEVVDGFLPELGLAQMPHRLEKDGRHFSIEYNPIGDVESFSKLLVIIREVTAVIEGERARREEAEILQLFSRILADKGGVLEFFSEANALVEAIDEGSYGREQGLRMLHTLKGNAGMFGIGSVADLVHRIESNVQESGQMPSAVDRATLRALWESITEKLRVLLDDDNPTEISIADRDYEALLEAVRDGAPRDQLKNMLEAWRMEPLAVRFARIGEQAERLSRRLEKPLEVRIVDLGIRLDSERLSDVWAAFPHLIRNAVDHGIEAEPRRRAAGKPPVSELRLEAGFAGQHFFVAVADDGAGLDWNRLRLKAQEKGLPTTTEAQLIEGLFADGVSTKDEVTELSGRGVGLSAVRQAVMESGGSLSVTSEPGCGTRFVMRWPRDIATAPIRSEFVRTGVPSIPANSTKAGVA